MADIISSQSGNIILRTPELGDGTEDNPVLVSIEGLLSVSNDVTVKGNLTVHGNVTSTDQTTLAVADSVIIANFGATSIDITTPQDGMGYVVDRGAYSIIKVGITGGSGTVSIIQRMDPSDTSVIKTDGSGIPVWRDDPNFSFHDQTIVIANENDDYPSGGLTPSPDEVNIPRSLIWDESTLLWDFSWNFDDRVDPDGNLLSDILGNSLPIEDVSIKGIVTPADVSINTDHVASIGYVNDRTTDVQDNLSGLEDDYLNVSDSRTKDHIMYWNDTPSGDYAGSWVTAELEIVKDKTPQLGGQLDVNNWAILGDDIVLGGNSTDTVSIEANNAGGTVDIESANSVTLSSTSLILNGVSHPGAPGTEGQILRLSSNSQLEFVDVSSLPSDKLANVVDDTTPQLGGDLDVNGKKITGAIDIESTGDLILDTTSAVRIRPNGGLIELNPGSLTDISGSEISISPINNLTLKGVRWPSVAGDAGNVLTLSSSGVSEWTTFVQEGVYNITTSGGLLATTIPLTGDYAGFTEVDLNVKVGDGLAIVSDNVVVDLSNDSGLLTDSTGLSVSFGTGNTDVARGDHIHANVTISEDGFMSSADKEKLDGIEGGAKATTAGNIGDGEGESYAYNIDSKLYFRTIEGGTNIAVSQTSDTITISSAGAISSVIAGEGLTGGGSTGDVTLNVDSTVARSDTAIIAGAGLTGGGDLSSDATINVIAGGGITVTADAVAHADTSSLTSINNSGGIVIQDLGFDTYGHVTSQTSVNLDDRFVNLSGDTMTGTLIAPKFNTNSALRYKEDVDYNVVDALSKVLSIDVIYYVSKNDKSKTRQLGVTAESVAKVAPEFVSFNDEGQADSVNYGQMTALLIQAIKEQEQNRPINIIRRFFARIMSKLK